MSKMIGKLYQKFDDGLMYLANKGLHAYNWVTGGTKADLANDFQAFAPIADVLGLAAVHPIFGLIGAPLSLLASHVGQKVNSNIESLEKKAIEVGAKDWEVELKKEDYHLLSGISSAAGAGYVTLGSVVEAANCDGRFAYLMGMGVFARSSAFYVMRCDYLPPRKNVFKRAKEKLDDAIQSYTREPAKVKVRK